MRNLVLYVGLVWAPPVGIFSAGLALLGMFLAVVELKGWRRWSVFSLSLVLGLAEAYAIVVNDKAHAREVKELHDQIASQPQRIAIELSRRFDDLEKKLPTAEQKKIVVQAKNEFILDNLTPEERKIRIGKARMALMMACTDCDQEGARIGDRNAMTHEIKSEAQLVKRINETVHECLVQRYADYLEGVAVRDALLRRYGIHDDQDEDIKHLDEQINKYVAMKKNYQ